MRPLYVMCSIMLVFHHATTAANNNFETQKIAVVRNKHNTTQHTRSVLFFFFFFSLFFVRLFLQLTMAHAVYVGSHFFFSSFSTQSILFCFFLIGNIFMYLHLEWFIFSFSQIKNNSKNLNVVDLGERNSLLYVLFAEYF